ncbi:hypothetical protein MHF_0330 [Mycoplasma haemofelis Ohio2]|uniref:Uncharacterized protein n=1 Tax=Mycoplasma haemofelis (strain Ohio2) TaxID=859194 RepID=F6FGT6_MYCHI|nr:hypothetical protein MHF_0330 [Mycoplasma haemofelis Ohio2]
MSFPLTTKVALGSLASCSVVGGGILMGSNFFGKDQEKTSLSSLMKTKNPEKRLISRSVSGSDATWKAAWKRYLDSNSNVWALTIGTAKKDGNDEAPAAFLNKCAENSDALIENERDPLYSQVLSYCTRDTLIKDLISESGSRRFLDGTSGKDTAEWKAAWEAYKSKNTNKEDKQDKWSLSDWKDKHSQGEALDSFKNKCTEKSSINAYSQSSLVEDYGLVLDWCTIKV